MGNKYLLKVLVAAHSPDVRSTLKGARFGIDGFGFVHEALRLRASPFVMLADIRAIVTCFLDIFSGATVTLYTLF